MKTVLTLMMVVLMSITGITSLKLFIYSHWMISALLTLAVVVSIILCINLLTNTEEASKKYSLH